ncbi:MAG: sarcosine oxidase subunit delta [Alphaproteobacteria bacterium]|nr:sarcosine oxidase subunit delta [Alphaproteobacteria bacterium]
MKILNCPLNGPRNIAEFIYGGEVTQMPDPNACSDAEWADYVLMENNTAGVIREWWCHAATAYWFIAERNTVTDEIIRTCPAREVFQARVAFDGPAEEGEG